MHLGGGLQAVELQVEVDERLIGRLQQAVCRPHLHPDARKAGDGNQVRVLVRSAPAALLLECHYEPVLRAHGPADLRGGRHRRLVNGHVRDEASGATGGVLALARHHVDGVPGALLRDPHNPHLLHPRVQVLHRGVWVPGDVGEAAVTAEHSVDVEAAVREDAERVVHVAAEVKAGTSRTDKVRIVGHGREGVAQAANTAGRARGEGGWGRVRT